MTGPFDTEAGTRTDAPRSDVTDGRPRRLPATRIDRRGFLSTAAVGVAAATGGCTAVQRDGEQAPRTTVSPSDISVETTIEVSDGETLNGALDGVEGAVRVVLPAGVTEYDAPITRTATTTVEGQGKQTTVLRPSADVKLVQQTETIQEWNSAGDDTAGRPDRRPLTNAERDQPNLYDGSLAFADLTIDRDNRPAPRVRSDGAAAPNFLLATATDRLAFTNVRMEKFDFADTGGVLMHAAGRLDEIAFRNVTIDFQAGGGVTNRPRRGDRGGRAGVGVLLFDGDADRFLVDEHSVIQGNTLARPPRVEPENWGSIMGIGGNVFDRGDIDCEFREWDYGAWKSGGPAAEGATLAFRGDNLDAGFADQYWPVPIASGGNVLWEGVTLTSAENNVYHDYGFKTTNTDRFADGFASVRVRNCSISGRGNPFQTIGGGVDEVEIRNVEIATRNKGVRAGSGRIGRLDIDGLVVRPHESLAYYTTPIELHEGDWGPEHRIANVEATGYLMGPIDDRTGDDVTIHTENVHGDPAEITYDEGMDLGLMPRTEGVDGTKSPGYYSILWRRHPGTFSVGEDFTVFEGERKTRDHAKVMVSWDADLLYCSFTLPGQGNVPPSTETLEDGQIVRIGVAPDDPDPDSWVEVDAARTADGHRAYLREYPGGDGRVADAPVGSSIDEEYGNVFMEVGIPWEVTGVNTEASSIRLDVGIRNADANGVPIGRLQLFESNGIWSSHDPADYKRAQLLGDEYGPGDPRAGLHG